MIFRFDDVCVNADMDNHLDITEFLHKKYPKAEIVWAINPIVKYDQKLLQRVFPKIWNAHSDFRKFYEMDHFGVVDVPDYVTVATHGLIHVDHRLLTKEVQELSIVLSANLVGATNFVPPFNKWNKATEEICYEFDIELMKFEDGWKCMEYEPFEEFHGLWYLHARDWKLKTVREWFE